MRYPASEKLEIIRTVEQSHLPAKRTLDQLGIDFASRDRPEEVNALEQWMKRIIPPDRDVPYHYLAVRALLGVSVHSRSHFAARVPRAFLNVQKKPSFSGWFTLRPTLYVQNATFYHRPKLEFDL